MQPPRLALRPAAVARATTLAAAVTGLVSPLQATEVDLAEALRRGAERPAADAAVRRADAVDEAGRAQRRLAYLPTLGASYQVADRDRDLELQTPIGSFPFGSSRADTAAVELTQPLFDPVRLLHTNPATHLESDASRLTARRTTDALAAAAGEAYLNVLALEAGIEANRAFVTSLLARLDETEARVVAGRALEADALKIRLTLETAELEVLSLEQRLEVARSDLGRALGMPGSVDAAAAPDWVRRPLPTPDAALDLALAARPDLAALDLSADAVDRRRAAVTAEMIPRLDARVGWTWTDGSPYTEDNWVEGAVVVSWRPFAAGTRAPRAAALSAERDALRADLAEARRAVEIEVRDQLARLVTAREAVDVSRRGVEQATETVRVERERNAVGRTTTNELLQAEAELRDQNTRLEIARLEVVRAWLRLWLAIGDGDVEALVAG
jgi:outer membrane protein TolC